MTVDITITAERVGFVTAAVPGGIVQEDGVYVTLGDHKQWLTPKQAGTLLRQLAQALTEDLSG